MIRFVFAFFVCALFAVPTRAADGETAQQILGLNAVVQTATRNYDTATLSRLITDDYTLVTGSGTVWNRRSFLADAGDRSAAWEVNQPEDVTVRSYNGDCALVIAVLHMRFKQSGVVHDLRVRYTDVWVKLNGEWRYASGQATLLKHS
ncbi:MAG TPA: nuclear transport factor 2 family protein [Candidatus Baltobacteraceae bacterium]|jgi:ketosteroid isomerase-like protein|nr:nuclear transport factor 2 family protein [Candidatus Baltobacteraceae bacterium]